MWWLAWYHRSWRCIKRLLLEHGSYVSACLNCKFYGRIMLRLLKLKKASMKLYAKFASCSQYNVSCSVSLSMVPRAFLYQYFSDILSILRGIFLFVSCSALSGKKFSRSKSCHLLERMGPSWVSNQGPCISGLWALYVTDYANRLLLKSLCHKQKFLSTGNFSLLPKSIYLFYVVCCIFFIPPHQNIGTYCLTVSVCLHKLNMKT